MPAKSKAARKPAPKKIAVVRRAQSKPRAVVASVEPGRKSRYALAPLILSVVGAYLLIYFGFLANLSTDIQKSLLNSAGVEPLQTNLWAFVGMFAVIVALVLFLLAEKWYEKKAYFTPRKDPIAIREDVLVLGTAGVMILLSFLGCISQEIFGISANIFLLFVVLLALVLMAVFLYMVRKNAQSMPSA
jgi:MFS family permease